METKSNSLNHPNEMLLKCRSIKISEELFHDEKQKAVEWNELKDGHYIAFNNAPGNNFYVHDAHILKHEKDHVTIWNPGRSEESEYY